MIRREDELMGVISNYYTEKYSGILAERDAKIESMSKELKTKEDELKEEKAKNKKLMEMLKKLNVTAVL